MNRRDFLRFILTAPIVGPVALKAITLSQPAISFVSSSAGDVVKRWSESLWTKLPREIYWGKFMKEDELIRGSIIRISRIRKLSEPQDKT